MSYEKYYWLNDDSRLFLERGYLVPGTTPEKRIRDIAEHAETILNKPGFADKFEDYMARGFYSLASPIWSNFGLPRGLPISCNGTSLEDTIDSILYKTAEVGMQTKYGAGTSVYLGNLRSRGTEISVGGTSSGPVHFAELFNATVNVISQSNIRRGSCAVYLPVEHPDIMEFLQIKSEGNLIQDLSFGVTITDAWMEDLVSGVNLNRDIWAAIIKKRYQTGYPYIMFTDTVNKNAPQAYRDFLIQILASNLCSETAISSGINPLTKKDESFVCDLSSINLFHWDEIKYTDAVEVLTWFLDAVMSEYIEKVKGLSFMEPSYNFAVAQRALGVGGLGWHSYLQENMIPFESLKAKAINIEIWKHIDEKTLKASKEMAEVYGEPELLKGYGVRNITRVAIAPTTSSSFILGQVSKSIEPMQDNYFVADLAKGKFSYKNPKLKEILQAYEKDNEATWKSILKKGGSVQHLDFLSNHEKDVFKTFGEISQKEIVIQAAARQKYIDQSQSLNLMIHPKSSAKEASELLIYGWREGIKTFYYQKGTNAAQELGRASILECVSCQS